MRTKVPYILLLTSLLFLSSCGDMVESQVKRGKYTVRYSDSSNKQMAERLAADLESSGSPFTEFRLYGSGAQHHYRLDIEAHKNSELTDERRGVLASTIARGYSRKTFNGDTCTVYLYPSLTPKARFYTTGTSTDPRLDSVSSSASNS